MKRILTLFLMLLTATLFSCKKSEDVNPKIVSSTTFEVPEDTLTIGTITVVDVENNQLTFSILEESDPQKLFSIDNDGQLSLATGKKLDFETKTKHLITIGVSDKVNTTNTEITINVTDRNEVGEYVQGGIIIWVNPNNNSLGRLCALEDASAAKNLGSAISYCNNYRKVDAEGTNWAGWTLPSIEHLKNIYKNKDAINKGLTDNGGDKFKEDNYYWSSTVISNTNNTALDMSNEKTEHSFGALLRYVRPSRDFSFEIK